MGISSGEVGDSTSSSSNTASSRARLFWHSGSDRWRPIVGGRLLPWALAGVDLGHEVVEPGNGPGLTTHLLAKKVARLTAVVIDPYLATAVADPTTGTNA